MAVLTFQVSGRDRWATVGWALHETGLFLRIGFWVIASVFADAAILQCSLELAARRPGRADVHLGREPAVPTPALRELGVRRAGRGSSALRSSAWSA